MIQSKQWSIATVSNSSFYNIVIFLDETLSTTLFVSKLSSGIIRNNIHFPAFAKTTHYIGRMQFSQKVSYSLFDFNFHPFAYIATRNRSCFLGNEKKIETGEHTAARNSLIYFFGLKRTESRTKPGYDTGIIVSPYKQNVINIHKWWGNMF